MTIVSTSNPFFKQTIPKETQRSHRLEYLYTGYALTTANDSNAELKVALGRIALVTNSVFGL